MKTPFFLIVLLVTSFDVVASNTHTEEKSISELQGAILVAEESNEIGAALDLTDVVALNMRAEERTSALDSDVALAGGGASGSANTVASNMGAEESASDLMQQITVESLLKNRIFIKTDFLSGERWYLYTDDENRRNATTFVLYDSAGYVFIKDDQKGSFRFNPEGLCIAMVLK